MQSDSKEDVEMLALMAALIAGGAVSGGSNYRAADTVAREAVAIARAIRRFATEPTPASDPDPAV